MSRHRVIGTNLSGENAGWSYFADCLEGVLEACEERGWELALHPTHRLPKFAAEGGVDGIVASLGRDEDEKMLGRLRVPVVNVSNRLRPTRLPRVTNDDYAVGQMAAEFFLARHFERFAYIGAGIHLSGLREEGFRKGLGARPCRNLLEVLPGRGVEESGESVLMIEALAGLRRVFEPPVAIFACNDARARRVLETAESAGWKVPGELAVLGVDNDAMLCRLNRPRLSSIEIAGKAVGRTAVGLIERMGRGEAAPRKPIVIPPLRVVERESTDLTAIEDPRLRDILAWLETPAASRCDVNGLCQRFHITRKSLERLFARMFWKTPKEVIRQIHLRQARALLTDSRLSIGEVSEQLGYEDPKSFSMAFKAATGRTPRDYRRQLFGTGGS